MTNDDIIEQPPPHSDEAEEAVLGALLIGAEEAAAAVAHMLSPADFWRQKHAWTYEAVLDLYRKGEPIHQVSVHDRLKAAGRLDDAGGMAWLSYLITATPTSVYAKHYAEQVRDYAVRRSTIAAMVKLMESAYRGAETTSDLLDAAEREIAALRRGTGQEGRTLHQAIEGLLGQIGPSATSLPVMTGLVDLDRFLGGLYPGQLIVLAAKTSQGKSALAHQTMAAAARDGHGVLCVSEEMPAEEVAGRMVATESRVPFAVMRRWAEMQEYQEREVMEAAGVLAELPVVIEDRQMDVAGVRSAAKRVQAAQGLGLVIVDYLQLVKSAGRRSSTRAEDVGGIARDLKALAMEMRVPVLALSQYNRDVGDQEPKLENLRESGDIEHSADVALLMWRPDKERPSVTEIKIEKNRNGARDRVRLYFDAPLTTFRELEIRR